MIDLLTCAGVAVADDDGCVTAHYTSNCRRFSRSYNDDGVGVGRRDFTAPTPLPQEFCGKNSMA